MMRTSHDGTSPTDEDDGARMTLRHGDASGAQFDGPG
jgi:hypothetical protein